MAGAIARSALPSLQAPLKIVVCDCDYTLWHGAVGEVGAMDVLFHRRHLQLHRRLVALLQRGVYICLCSRNTPEDVWDVMAREESVLRREHISAHRISPMLRKSEAVASLAASFEAGLDTVLFIDDNATEIADVRTALPEVPCWLFPCSPIHENGMALAEMDHVWRLDITGQPTSTAADASRTSASAITARQHVRAALSIAQHEGSASPPASSADGVPSPLAAFHADLRTQITFLERATSANASCSSLSVRISSMPGSGQVTRRSSSRAPTAASPCTSVTDTPSTAWWGLHCGRWCLARRASSHAPRS